MNQQNEQDEQRYYRTKDTLPVKDMTNESLIETVQRYRDLRRVAFIHYSVSLLLIAMFEVTSLVSIVVLLIALVKLPVALAIEKNYNNLSSEILERVLAGELK